MLTLGVGTFFLVSFFVSDFLGIGDPPADNIVVRVRLVMKTSEFDYSLPSGLIAQYPLPSRSGSRMMVLHRDSELIEHRRFNDIVDYLQTDDLLVLNDTRVIAARLSGHWTDTGGKVEVLLLEEKGNLRWHAMCRTRRTVTRGLPMVLAECKIQGKVAAVSHTGSIELELSCDGDLKKILEKYGIPPVPPYIRRPDDRPELVAEDRERYQTVYARVPGAVAAPTAGLHFTESLLRDLRQHGIVQTAVTLHVGSGTFRPVSTKHVEEYVMESEQFSLSPESARIINRAIVGPGRIIAVGSTSVRTLESIMAERGRIEASQGRSALFIYPPYTFKVVDVLLTNFHLPKSTLVMMVSAFMEAGDAKESGRERLLSAYDEAIKEGYRFYSYGDCMLIL